MRYETLKATVISVSVVSIVLGIYFWGLDFGWGAAFGVWLCLLNIRFAMSATKRKSSS